MFEQAKSAGVAIHKGWVAKILGADQTYKFSREFVQPTEFYRSNSGKKICQRWTSIGDGVYEVRGLTSHQDGFYAVTNGSAVKIDEREVLVA